jgi:hypothetical protein
MHVYYDMTGELKQAFAQMGKRMSDEEMDILFKQYDIDGGGQIEFSEFKHMVKSHLKIPCQPGCTCCQVLFPDNQAQTGDRVQDEMINVCNVKCKYKYVYNIIFSKKTASCEASSVKLTMALTLENFILHLAYIFHLSCRLPQ